MGRVRNDEKKKNQGWFQVFGLSSYVYEIGIYQELKPESRRNIHVLHECVGGGVGKLEGVLVVIAESRVLRCL